MSELTKQALKVDNNQSFPNNNAGLITPTNLRTFNENMIDSTVNQAVYTADSASFNQRINAISGSSGTVATGSLLTTASFASQNLTFTKGDGSQFSLFIPDNSGSVLPSGVVSGSAQISALGFQTTASFNTYTSSNDSKVNSLINATSSYAISSSVAAVDAGQQLQINSLIAATSSYATSAITASSLITASFSGNTLTFTKGNGTTFGVVIPDVSGSTINTGSFATTGSNNFIGEQTITGSIVINESGSAFGDALLIKSGKLRVDAIGNYGGDLNINGGGGGVGDLNLSNTYGGNSIKLQLSGINSIIGNTELTGALNITGSLTASLQQGYAWVGNSSGKTQAIPTSSFGGGGTGNGFPFSGSAVITGSLSVSETIKSQVYINPQTIDGFTIPTGNNAMLVGPVAVSGSIVVEGTSNLIVLSQVTSSSTPLPSGVVSGSSQISYPLISNIPAGIVSGSSQLTSSYDLRYALSGSGGGTIPTGSFATTGSNTFIGNQTITGSLLISSSDVIRIVAPSFLGAPAPGGVSVTGSFAVEGNFAVNNGNCVINQINTGKIVGIGAGLEIVSNTIIHPGAGGGAGKSFGVSGSAFVSQSIQVGEAVRLSPSNPLPSGTIGSLAVSGSSLFFYNGAWTLVV